MFSIDRRIDKKPYNCNNCGATNYETKWFKQVDYLTHISVGNDSCVMFRLCDDCFKEFISQLNSSITNI